MEMRNFAKFSGTPFFIKHLRWLFSGISLQIQTMQSSAKVHRKTLVMESFLTEVLVINFNKKGHRDRCFPITFTKSSRIVVLQGNTFRKIKRQSFITS